MVEVRVPRVYGFRVVFEGAAAAAAADEVTGLRQQSCRVPARSVAALLHVEEVLALGGAEDSRSLARPGCARSRILPVKAATAGSPAMRPSSRYAAHDGLPTRRKNERERKKKKKRKKERKKENEEQDKRLAT